MLRRTPGAEAHRQSREMFHVKHRRSGAYMLPITGQERRFVRGSGHHSTFERTPGAGRLQRFLAMFHVKRHAMARRLRGRGLALTLLRIRVRNRSSNSQSKADGGVVTSMQLPVIGISVQ